MNLVSFKISLIIAVFKEGWGQKSAGNGIQSKYDKEEEDLERLLKKDERVRRKGVTARRETWTERW